MRVLVTGGSGFVGSHVIDRLLAHGYTPRIFDRAASPHHDSEDVETVLGDVTDLQALKRAMTDCEAVVHLAAIADVADVEANPDHAEAVNTGGTLKVLEAARHSGVNRVVYGSTIWVYSDCEETAVDEETHIPPPQHLYTATKLAGELYCQSYAEIYGIEWTILRFGIPYGPRARAAAVVPAFINKALRGEPLTVAGTGSQGRRFVYVEDLAEGVVLGLQPVAANRIYNLSGTETVTILDVAETVRDIVGDTEIVHTPARTGDFSGKEVANARAAEELGWAPSTPFSEGVRRYVTWLETWKAPNVQAPATNGETFRDAQAPVDPDAPTVLILTADIGEGHDLPARAIAVELCVERPGAQVAVVDGLAAVGRVLQMLIRDGSWITFRWFPWVFEAQYFFLTRFAPTRWLAGRLGYLFAARKLLRLIRAHDPDAVVSTYPGVTQLLGDMRERGRLDIPVFSAITDLAGLRFWAHPGIDLHTVTHRESIEEVERIAGAGSARWARPPTSPEFLVPRSRGDARHALDLAEDGKVIVVSGGGWGMGDLRGAVRAGLSVEGSTVICITGRNESARRRIALTFGSDERVRIIGFTEQMSDMLAAADVLVHSTAGLTVLEAQIRGCPVISYGFGIGHIRANNNAYRRFGLARVAGSEAELRTALGEALEEHHSPDPSFANLPSPSSLVLETGPRVRPVPVWRMRLRHAATAAAAAIVLAGWSLATDVPYSLFSKAFHLRPTTAVSTNRPEVGVLIDAPLRDAPRLARALSRQHARASFLFTDIPAPSTLASIRELGDEPLPALRPGGPIRWIRTRGYLKSMTAGLGLSGDFHYAVPSDGFTLGQYVLAHGVGGSPVAPAIRYHQGNQLSLRPGEIIEVSLDPSAARPAATINSLIDQLHQRRLRALTLGALMRGAARSTSPSA